MPNTVNNDDTKVEAESMGWVYPKWKWAFIAANSVKFKRMSEQAIIPERQREGDACFDLFSVQYIMLPPGEWFAVDTGLQMEMPMYLEARIRPRSGLALNSGVTVLNAPGTIDSGYRGNVKVILINHSSAVHEIHVGDRIAQMSFHGRVETEFEEVKELDDSERGEGGFGSTGD